MIDLQQKAIQLRTYLTSLDVASFTPPPALTPEEWVEEGHWEIERGPIKGKFRIANFEIARGPIRLLLASGVSQISIMASAQIMKTSTLQVALAYILAMDPREAGVFFPNDALVKKFTKEKFEPMIESSKAMADVFGGKESLSKKREDYTDKAKVFPGGSISFGSAENPRGLASSTYEFVGMDEVSKMKVTSGGDPILLGNERIKNSPRKQLLVTSTPEDVGCIISREYAKSDMRRPYVKCPSCSEWEYFTWERFIYKDDQGQADPDNAHHVCPHCSHAWTEQERIKAITTPESISWRQTRPFECCDERQEPEAERLWSIDGIFGDAYCKHCGQLPVSRRHSGFWAWEAYHPITSSAELARQWIGAQSSPGEIEGFLKSKLARTFARQAEAQYVMEPDTLQARMEPAWTWLPAGVKYITAGFDVQGDRIEGEFVGWGEGDESWSLKYVVLEGDTLQDAVWYALDEELKGIWHFEDGREMSVAAACVDAGFRIDTVLAFTQIRKSRRIFAVMSADGAAGSRRSIWPQGSRATIRKKGAAKGHTFYAIGSQSAKDRIGSFMQIQTPGPGYMHIPTGRHEKWFQMMSAEVKKQVHKSGGGTGYYWTGKVNGSAREAWDARVYATAALECLRSAGLISKASAPGAAAQPRYVNADGEIVIGASRDPEDTTPVPRIKRKKPKVRLV